MSPVIQLQSASAEHRDVRRRYAAYLSPVQFQTRLIPFQPRLQASLSPLLLWSDAPFPRLKRELRSGILDTGQPFSYRYELRTQHRLESVATRTPPPICTSAQSPQTALAWKTVERREQFEPTRWLADDNHGISRVRRLFATVATLHVLTAKPSF
jgi:hypothetical protein